MFLLWECIFCAMDVNLCIFDEMALVPPQRLRLESLRLQVRQIHRQEENIVAAVVLLEKELARQERRRTVCVRPWLLRRTTLGHYDTLMQELMRNFKSYLRIELAMFCEMLDGGVAASRCAFKTVRLTYGSLAVPVRWPYDLSAISI